jgi:purine-cytosine permease-like protein
VALVFLAAITTAVSVYGYFIVHRYERYAWIPMLILFGYLFFASASHFNLNNVPATGLSSGLAIFVGIATFGGAVFGYAVGWSSYAADYTRRQPVNTPARTVFWYAFIGVTVPCILLEILGVLLTSVAGGASLVGGPPGPLFAHDMGGSAIASVVLLLLAFSTIANNVPNDYSFALSTQVIGLRVKRWVLTIIGAIIYVIVALLLQEHFGINLENFLLIIAYWLGAWNAIVLIEHWLRKGQYPAQDYENAAKLPVGIAAVASMVIGLAVTALGVSQQIFTGPLAHALGNKDIGYADVGFPLAIIVTGVLYYVLRKWELARYKR